MGKRPPIGHNMDMEVKLGKANKPYLGIIANPEVCTVHTLHANRGEHRKRGARIPDTKAHLYLSWKPQSAQTLTLVQ